MSGELALNRAVVVLTVAAWQAYVQDATRVAIDRLKPGGPPQQSWNLTNAQASRAIHLFSTPNAENTRDLLLYAGFDPNRAGRGGRDARRCPRRTSVPD